MSTYLHVPDVSEYQTNVDWAAVAQHNGGAAIIRAYNGHRVDHAWYGGARRVDAHKHGVRVLGIYAYLAGGVDWHAQAREFVSIVGKLVPGEFVVLDVEETGHTASDVEGWLAYVDQHLHYPGYNRAWLYSSDWFAKGHHLSGIFRSSRHTWLAAYQPYEPHDLPHTLWQHSCSETWPGIGKADCSLFHGDVAALEAKVWTRPDKTPHPASPAPKPVDHSPHGGHGPAHRPTPKPTPAAPSPAHAKAAAPILNLQSPLPPAKEPVVDTTPSEKSGPDWGQISTEIKHALILALTSFFGSAALQPQGGHWDKNALLAAALAAVRLSLGTFKS